MALIPAFYLDCVVAIGFPDQDGKPKYVATGFLYGKFVKQEANDKYYQVFLVTNKHVFTGEKLAHVRCNPESDAPAREYELPLVDGNGGSIWFGHSDPDVDVAVVTINTDLLTQEGIRIAFFRSDADVIDKKKARELGLSEGDGVFVLGFPMGLIGEGRNFVIVRHGVIARIRDTLAGKRKEFLVDSTVFPGNSGGPVVTRPEILAIHGTTAHSRTELLGIVASYVPYQDVAVSTQTKRPRIIFEENSGLTSIFPLDYINEVVDVAMNMIEAKEQETPFKVDAAQPDGPSPQVQS